MYDPDKAKQLLAEAGHAGGFDAGFYTCDVAYANLGEAALNNLAAVGIRAKLRPLERAAFFKGYGDKKFKNIIQGASGAFGNAATRLEEFVVKGGDYAYGSYPEIDELFPQQAVELDRTKRAAILDEDAATARRADDVCVDLAACVHQRRRAAGGAIRLRPDQGLRLHRALRGHHAEEHIEGVVMRQFIARRLGYSLLSLLVLSLTIFFFVRVTGDPAALLVEPGASEEDIAAIHQKFGLDQPLWMQYGLFMVSLLRGDFGQSFYYQTPVFELYLDRLPNSLLLAVVAMAFSLLVGIPSGILAAVRVGRFWDSAGKLFALLGLSLPSFFVGLVMILVFSVYLGWLPSSGSGGALHLIMPAFALGWYFAAAHMRLTRSSMLEVLGSEYVKLARLKGLPQALVIGKHAFKNALIPVLTLAGINLVLMINVAVVVETVFAWPGIGRLLYEGISFRDFPVVQGVVIMGGTMIVVVNLLVDVVYAVIDPRIRLEK